MRSKIKVLETLKKMSESIALQLIWPVGQAVKTPASHAGNGGSIPPRVTRNNDGESRSLYTDRCRALRKQRQSPVDFEADVKATCRAIGEVGVDGA